MGKLEQQGAEETGSFRRFPKPQAGPCGHLLHCPPRCLLLRQPQKAALGHTEMGQGGGQPRGPCLPLGKASLHPQLFRMMSGRLSPEPAPLFACSKQEGLTNGLELVQPQLEILLSCWSLVLPASCRCEHHLKAQARGHGNSQRRNMQCVRS